MGRGSYLGGSTVIGPGSSWFGNGSPTKSRPLKIPKRKLSAKQAKIEAARKEQAAKQKALRKVSPAPQSPKAVALRLNRRMKNVEVLVRGGTGIVRVVKSNKTQRPTHAGRKRLGLKSPEER